MDVALDIEEFRSWFPGLTETVINDVLLGVLWDQVGAIVGTTDADSFAPFDPDATPPVLERKVLLYYALCHMATLSTRGDQPVAWPVHQKARCRHPSISSRATRSPRSGGIRRPVGLRIG